MQNLSIEMVEFSLGLPRGTRSPLTSVTTSLMLCACAPYLRHHATLYGAKFKLVKICTFER